MYEMPLVVSVTAFARPHGSTHVLACKFQHSRSRASLETDERFRVVRRCKFAASRFVASTMKESSIWRRHSHQAHSVSARRHICLKRVGLKPSNSSLAAAAPCR
jgi:hypothetical protein